jgi:nucleoside-diphosphate-sugar epimerase
MNCRILITGINGFIGNNLVDKIGKINQIWGLDINIEKKQFIIKTYFWNELDLVPEVDVLIHLAGKSHDLSGEATFQQYYEVNTCLTQKIFDYFINSSIQKFIYFSSVKAVKDEMNENELLAENCTTTPTTVFGKSKLEAERYILSKPLASEKKVYILRPTMIHGPGNKGNLNLLYKLVSKGIPWPLGAFENKRSFTSIDNVAFVVQQIIEKNIESGIYNLADDEPLSTNQLIELIAQSKGKKANIWKIPQRIILVSAKLGGLLRLPLNPERLKKLTESYVVSNQKIKQALGINKMPTNAEDGMIKTLKSFK